MLKWQFIAVVFFLSLSPFSGSNTNKPYLTWVTSHAERRQGGVDELSQNYQREYLGAKFQNLVRADNSFEGDE